MLREEDARHHDLVASARARCAQYVDYGLTDDIRLRLAKVVFRQRVDVLLTQAFYQRNKVSEAREASVNI